MNYTGSTIRGNPVKTKENKYSCKSLRVANALGYNSMSDLIIDKRGEGLSLKEIAGLTGLSIDRLVKYTPKEIKGEYRAMTPARENQIKKWKQARLDSIRLKNFDTKKTLAEMDKVKRRLFG